MREVMKLKKREKANKGITLIALVITIIVLLILAAVSIAMLTGENGILAKVKEAKEKTNKETAAEIIKLKITDLQMKIYDKEQRIPTLQELADAFCEDNEIAYVNIQKEDTAKINDKITIGENTKIYTKLEEYPYEFEIGSDLQIARIDGEEMGETDLANKEPEGYIKPSGTKQITTNGEHDVSSYEKVNVNVETDAKYTEEEYKQYGTDKYEKGFKDGRMFGIAVGLEAGLLVEYDGVTSMGMEWRKITATYQNDIKGININLESVPSFICIKTETAGGTKITFYSYDACNTFYSFNESTGANNSTSAWSISDKQLKFYSENVTAWGGTSFDIYILH